jgi:hypothetical protein
MGIITDSQRHALAKMIARKIAEDEQLNWGQPSAGATRAKPLPPRPQAGATKPQAQSQTAPPAKPLPSRPQPGATKPQAQPQTPAPTANPAKPVAQPLRAGGNQPVPQTPTPAATQAQSAPRRAWAGGKVAPRIGEQRRQPQPQSPGAGGNQPQAQLQTPAPSATPAKPVARPPGAGGNHPVPQTSTPAKPLPQLPRIRGHKPSQIRLDGVWVEPANPDPGQGLVVRWRGEALVDFPARKDRLVIHDINDHDAIDPQTVKQVKIPKGPVQGQERFHGLPKGQYQVVLDVNLEGVDLKSPSGSFFHDEVPGRARPEQPGPGEFWHTEGRIVFFVGELTEGYRRRSDARTNEDQKAIEEAISIIEFLAKTRPASIGKRHPVDRKSAASLIESATLLAGVTTLDSHVGRNSELKVELARISKSLARWQEYLPMEVWGYDPINTSWAELMEELVSVREARDAPGSLAARLIEITPKIIALRPLPDDDKDLHEDMGNLSAVRMIVDGHDRQGLWRSRNDQGAAVLSKRYGRELQKVAELVASMPTFRDQDGQQRDLDFIAKGLRTWADDLPSEGLVDDPVNAEWRALLDELSKFTTIQSLAEILIQIAPQIVRLTPEPPAPS